MAASNRSSRRIDGSAYNGSAGSQSLQLPAGSCNFRDLTSGGKAPVCGCKQFWLDAGLIAGQRAYCFCGHHACFHTVLSQQRTSPAQAVHVEAREEATRQQRTPEGYRAVHHAGAGASQSMATGLGILHQTQSQSINTRVWEALNGFARQQEGGTISDTTSKLPSTAVPSTCGEESTYQRPMGPPVTIPNAAVMRPGVDEYVGSATEVATPSIAGTPDLRAFMPPGSQARMPSLQPHSIPPQVARPHSEPAQPYTAAVASHSTATNTTGSISITAPDLRHLIEAYGRRLDILESMSFSHVSGEDIHDKFEHHDLRILELETWRADQDHADAHREYAPGQAATSSSMRRRLLPDEATSFSSDGSFDMTAAAHTEAAVLATIATNMENAPRFNAIENRLTSLEDSAPPSMTRPWHVQVVLLPWGRHMRGIWFGSDVATQQSQRSAVVADEWTGAKSLAKTSFNSSTSAAWTTESIEAWAQDAQDWLSPKACGPNGTVFQRLASRGFVRELSLTASDARHISDRLLGAFAKLRPVAERGDLDVHQKYLGLQEPYIPLRKVRKSARLRFLTPAEMVTPATWTAEFLDSSVFMKVDGGQRRLYITTPEAYLQSGDDTQNWRALQSLPSVDIDSFGQSSQKHEGHAIEACWSYNDKLDRPPSLQSSFASNASHESQWSLKSQASAEQHQREEMQEPAFIPLTRPVRHRTVSLPDPTSAIDQQNAGAAQRRVASFDLASSSGHNQSSSDLASPATKRRRISISPEAERRGVNFTPRWSREPPSPFRSESNAGASRSGSGIARGTTPFAYATPHSNSHVVGLADLVGCGDGDTELGTDVAGNLSQQGDNDDGEEWHGVRDLTSDERDVDMDANSNGAMQDEELDDEDLERD
ncbi:hypothetical protein B0A48_05632 [Cryoendolithus antarcticus]|uniref:Uncharacterized protein n=1 Tax=Cryoendolithus antarcticus TaxID=1507870 RepID=A0A1V8TJ31_9PEZI|nr:hypothetical protein B0A48_05632 [Cryoendolithus antarcticus]